MSDVLEQMCAEAEAVVRAGNDAAGGDPLGWARARHAQILEETQPKILGTRDELREATNAAGRPLRYRWVMDTAHERKTGCPRLIGYEVL